jgi:hypothetical protein
VKNLPLYSLVGLALMALSEVLMFLHIEPFWSWHTPIAWTGYILFVDGLVRVRRGSSWLTHATGEFAFLAVMSIPLWLIFEGYNLLIRNWHYVNLPANPFWRAFGYAWSFATIWPAMFETVELVASFRSSPGDHHGGHRKRSAALGFRLWAVGSARDACLRILSGLKPEARSPKPVVTSVTVVVDRHRQPLSTAAWISVASGGAMLLWPLVRPSPYLAAPVWLGFFFLLDPLNHRAGSEAMWDDWDGSARERLVNLAIGGMMCGLIWEFWNYWARAKWIYTVPILSHLKIFEMPLPGYLGFPAFAVECFTMYVTARRWLWRGTTRPIGL